MTADAVGVGKELQLCLRLAGAAVLVRVLVNMNVMTKVPCALSILMLAIGRRHRIAKLQRQDQKQQDVQQSAHGTSLKTIPSERLGWMEATVAKSFAVEAAALDIAVAVTVKALVRTPDEQF